MKYIIYEDCIIIFDKNDFCPKHIFECGQVFRYSIIENGDYQIISGDKIAVISEFDDGYKIITKNVEYFKYYFDLDTDYKQIKRSICNNQYVKKAISAAYGIRILKQELFETMVSFIISANNNIKRIKQIIERLCARLGEKCGGYFAFPTHCVMQKQDEHFFNEIGAGYRSKYLVKFCGQFEKFSALDFESLSTDELRSKLVELSGVGPKVADCILLFAFSRTDVFPVDTWMEKAYYQYFCSKKRTRPHIANYLVSKFKDNSGYAQQYLFYLKAIEKD